MTVHKLRIDICDKTKREGANKKNFGEPSTPPHPSPLPPQAWWWGWQQKKGRCDDACNMTFSLRLQESNIHASGLLSISTPHSSSLCLFPDSSVHGPFCSFFYVFVSISQVYLRPNAFKPLHEKSTHSPTSYCNTKPTFSPRLYDHGRLFLRLFLYFLVSWLTTAIHSVLNRQFFFFFILCYSNRISLLLFLKCFSFLFHFFVQKINILQSYISHSYARYPYVSDSSVCGALSSLSTYLFGWLDPLLCCLSDINRARRIVIPPFPFFSDKCLCLHSFRLLKGSAHCYDNVCLFSNIAFVN